jgi:hypothetical protein
MDGAIVLRTGGPKATAFGMHHAAVPIMIGTAAMLLAG